MRRRICLIMCIIVAVSACVCLLSGCQQLPTLDQQTDLQLKTIYAHNDISTRIPAQYYTIRVYYGCYNQAHVLIMDGAHIHINNIESYTVAGMKFNVKSQNTITVIYNERCYTLEQAYQKNILTKQDLSKIHKLHLAYGTNTINGKTIKLPKMSNSIKQQIQKVVLPDQTRTPIYDYYGKYGNAHVFSTGGFAIDEYNLVYFATDKYGYEGYLFTSGHAIMVFVEGRIYFVTPAIANGYIPQDQLERLYNTIMCTGITPPQKIAN